VKITIAKLRKLVREEIIKEYNPIKGPFWNEDEDFENQQPEPELDDDLPDFGIHGKGKKEC